MLCPDYDPYCLLTYRVCRLVLGTLSEALGADPDRKCFRLIGGVLVERTVKDVVPALQTNHDGVRGLHSSLAPVYTDQFIDSNGDLKPRRTVQGKGGRFRNFQTRLWHPSRYPSLKWLECKIMEFLGELCVSPPCRLSFATTLNSMALVVRSWCPSVVCRLCCI